MKDKTIVLFILLLSFVADLLLLIGFLAISYKLFTILGLL